MRKYARSDLELPEPDGDEEKPSEWYFDSEGGRIGRTIRLRNGSTHTSYQAAIEADAKFDGDPSARFDLSWLNSTRKPRYGEKRSSQVRLADLFCGAGGLTLGVMEAGRATGVQVVPAFAADMESSVRKGYTENFAPAIFDDRPIEAFLDGDPHLDQAQHERDELTRLEEKLRERVGRVHIAVGGPPCQGHSNLNNHTRRDDPKNLLYGRMARFARVFEPDHLIIENVHGAAHDKGGILKKTRHALRRLGYQTDVAIIRGENIGIPQSRHRIFLVASRLMQPRIKHWERLHMVTQRSFQWAQNGLVRGNTALDSTTKLSPITKKRIDYLFREMKYELDDPSLRPDCHKDEDYTYKSVYGRIRPWLPAPTITTGFTVMGQGRFVHPACQRTLTPREGARLQFFPAWYSFGDVDAMTKKELVTLIGNAVPPKMAYVLALELLR